MTFGGKDNFGALGSTDVSGARRQIGMAMDAGVNCVDTADMYSAGAAEEILGEAIEGRRDQLVISTKVRMPAGDGPNDAGLSRHHIIRQLEGSLQRLRTDYVDIYHVHEWDGQSRHLWRRRSRHWTHWCGQARSAISASRTTADGS
ncbi:aryl-alcohol dehydrogenase-like predicted oxidoreductase [Actinopolymorpha pittospori]|uniref:Aryl-alcohol dehydrogenase-like predicted oxidoreductase n=2 Tax=Actinopolymorpha pittospori TaxID=648752 RepID=A0A927N3L4_9ACTN|nr:aryl-alcohol dehydrogenase-like predicted oxidoreductase [Actinopolymorpha pittospori]